MFLASTRILLASQTIDSFVNVSVHAFALTIFGVMPRILFGYAVTMESIKYDWVHMILISVSGMIGQYCLERALKMEKNTSMVAIFFSLGVVFNFVFDMVFFAKPFLWRKFIGCAIVIGSIYTIFHTKK